MAALTTKAGATALEDAYSLAILALLGGFSSDTALCCANACANRMRKLESAGSWMGSSDADPGCARASLLFVKPRGIIELLICLSCALP